MPKLFQNRLKLVLHGESKDSKEFRPHFRRSKSPASDSGKTFLSRLYSNLKKTRSSNSRRKFSRGRGRVYSFGTGREQRVLVKARVVKNRSHGSGLAVHVSYLEREGVGLSGARGRAFHAAGFYSDEEKTKFLQEAQADRHHFRFIVSPEHGTEIELESYARALMRRLERDLQTKLIYLSVVHRNTANAHVHLLIRGKTEDGEDLVLSRDYISRGIRRAAEQLATDELGPRAEKELQQATEKSIEASRFTSLDAQLLALSNKDGNGQIDLRSPEGRTKERLSLFIGRLQFLQSLGLSNQLAVGVWELGLGLEEKLRKLSIREDVIKRMHESMKVSGLKLLGELSEGVFADVTKGEVVNCSLLMSYQREPKSSFDWRMESFSM